LSAGSLPGQRRAEAGRAGRRAAQQRGQRGPGRSVPAPDVRGLPQGDRGYEGEARAGAGPEGARRHGEDPRRHRERGPRALQRREVRRRVAMISGSEAQAVEDPVLEFKFCVAALPSMLLLALLFHFLTPGLQRIVLGMPIHELGHAVAAWFTGFWAIPTLW